MTSLVYFVHLKHDLSGLLCTLTTRPLQPTLYTYNTTSPAYFVHLQHDLSSLLCTLTTRPLQPTWYTYNTLLTSLLGTLTRHCSPSYLVHLQHIAYQPNWYTYNILLSIPLGTLHASYSVNSVKKIKVMTSLLPEPTFLTPWCQPDGFYIKF